MATKYTDDERLNRYKKNTQLFECDHKTAFNVKRGVLQIDRESKLHYLAANFAGMLSRLSADTLFGFEEYPRISFVDDKTTKWVAELEFANSLNAQLYESALENSYRGDAILRIRAENDELIIEDLNPKIWFPQYNENNTRSAPKSHTFQWTEKDSSIIDPKSNKPYEITIQEVHTKGKITVSGFYGPEPKILTDQELVALGYKPVTETGVDELLVFHIPNSRTNDSFFGIDDYRDVSGLIEAINNRLTRIDNVLDKHGDPLLIVPDGVLDAEGGVSKDSFGLIEMAGGEGAVKPEYIVWDAKLESSFQMIEQLLESMYMVSETSPAAYGLDKNGVAESGKALKYKMLRTLAKKHRKQMYYDGALKRMLFVAQKFAKANKLKVNGMLFTGEPEIPTIEWKDGIINDATEIMDLEERKINAGLASKSDVLQRMEGMTKEQADERVAEADTERAAKAPVFNASPMSDAAPKPPPWCRVL